MKVELRIVDHDPSGKSHHGFALERCMVYREAGDRVRLDNASRFAQQFFVACGKKFASMKENELGEFITLISK